jgi:hypothetical protein
MTQKEATPCTASVPCRHILDGLLGQSITRVSIELWSVRLLFATGELHIEGEWRLLAPDGSIIDQSREFCARQEFQLWRIAGREVLGLQYSEKPLPEFVLRLADQWSLEVVADDDGLEDWSLTLRDSKVFCNGATITVFS